MVDNKPVNIGLWDINASEEYDRLRPLSYPQTDLFIVAFDISNPSSFERVRTRWFPEISHHCPSVPFVIVGTKLDLRADPVVNEKLRARDLEPVTYEAASKMAIELKAGKYVECSAFTHEGVDQVFEAAFRVALADVIKPTPRKRNCTLF